MAMARVGNEFSEEQRSMINVRSFVKDAMTETINQYYESILDEFDQYRVQQYEQGALLQKLTKCFNAYSDYLVFSKRFANAKIDVIERVMENVFHLLTDKYYLQLPGHFHYVFSRCLYLQMRSAQFDQDERVGSVPRAAGAHIPQRGDPDRGDLPHHRAEPGHQRQRA